VGSGTPTIFPFFFLYARLRTQGPSCCTELFSAFFCSPQLRALEANSAVVDVSGNVLFSVRGDVAWGADAAHGIRRRDRAFLDDPTVVEVMLNGRLWIDRLSSGLTEIGESLSAPTANASSG
jgi:hypothetical protein